MRNKLQAAVRYFKMRWEGKTDFEALAMCDRREMERAALSALRDALQRQPDPDTGLVPCGCGGKAETHELFGEYSGTYMTDCKECGTGTTQYSTKKESRDAWNTAMGRASE